MINSRNLIYTNILDLTYGSFYLILKGHKIIGSIFGATSFLALIGSFMSNINELSGNDDIAKQIQNKKND